MHRTTLKSGVHNLFHAPKRLQVKMHLPTQPFCKTSWVMRPKPCAKNDPVPLQDTICLAPHSAHSSNAITFLVATKRCCEPGAYLLWRKLMLFRPFLAKHPRTAALCEDTLSRYALAGLPGALALEAPLPCLPAAPPFGSGSRSAWTAQAHSVAGPLGLLCTAL